MTIELAMSPAPGTRLLRFVGDPLQIRLKTPEPLPEGWKAVLRTNLGRGREQRRQMIEDHGRPPPEGHGTWRNVPMAHDGEGWSVELTLCEAGWFEAKACAVSPDGVWKWPVGDNLGISVHPDHLRSGNGIYCSFPRLHGARRRLGAAESPEREVWPETYDEAGWSVIPPSGTFRDLIRDLDHIVDTLGCRILHLLPVNPTPTTFARMGRYGSPYAAQDLTAVDHALVEFDRRTTGVEQFIELADAVHGRGARLICDLAINHTGWGARMWNDHPEWYRRNDDGTFKSPGAWGVTWGDCVELDHDNRAMVEEMAEVFLTWCRRGVDGFRCDAGYMLPLPAWRYIIARVEDEYPGTLFLLEGLGGSIAATEELLTLGGMQWAYSELFQNYDGAQVAAYLDASDAISGRLGTLVHYSETHDNPRLASKGAAWSLMRNRLSGLTSQCGAFAFTAGVEWLATEKVRVHGCTGLSWGAEPRIVAELAALNHLLADHPCFRDGVTLRRISSETSPVLALERSAASGTERVLVLVNLDSEEPRKIRLDRADLPENPRDLLGGDLPPIEPEGEDAILIALPVGHACCLGGAVAAAALSGDRYRNARGRVAWALEALARRRDPEQLAGLPWLQVAEAVDADPEAFLRRADALGDDFEGTVLWQELLAGAPPESPGRVIVWELVDRRRVTPVPPDHWLLLRLPDPFRVSLAEGAGTRRSWQGIPVRGGYVAALAPATEPGEAELLIERHGELGTERIRAGLSHLHPRPALGTTWPRRGVALSGNDRGGMARIPVDLVSLRSKYDAVLATNPDEDHPTDRHVLVKRVRAWVRVEGFSVALDGHCLESFRPDPAPRWRFVVPTGDHRRLVLDMEAWMPSGSNTTALRFRRSSEAPAEGRLLPDDVRADLIVRLDLEDRSFHAETAYSKVLDERLARSCDPLPEGDGFRFVPERGRALVARSGGASYHPEPEWQRHIAHPTDARRGQHDEGDAWSPGWFRIAIRPDTEATLVLDAQGDDGVAPPLPPAERGRDVLGSDDPFDAALRAALDVYVVRRGTGRTVIAGYPWFLDWGRDTFICARGLLSAGLAHVVREILVTFGRFEESGTLPNTLLGKGASNRDTSDAPLWFGVVMEECAAQLDATLYTRDVDGHRNLEQVLRDIACGYLDGTANGIRVDPATALVWSPSHFTWMDTNHPAGTPREGYPVEIQVLWIRMLRQLERLGAAAAPAQAPWGELARRAFDAFIPLFWIPERGDLSDLLIAPAGTAASAARRDTALRSNSLFAVSLDVLDGVRARAVVAHAERHLVVPGALRSLAPLAVDPPLAIHDAAGHLLNVPEFPYQGRYAGDEDTRRKIAYHNGTAWTWTFPVFCEALAKAWDADPRAVAAARSYLGSMASILREGCVGQIPEVLDGDAPHRQRGCDAQAWGVTEALRVWRWLKRLSV